jgi:hypothetical protein
VSFPLRYAHLNVLVGHGDQRAALYALDTVSYPHRPVRDKLRILQTMAHFAFAAEADFSIYRVSRAHPASEYVDQAAGLIDTRYADPAAWREHLAGHQAELAELPSHVPEIYLAVSLQPARAAGPVAGLLAAGDRARRRLEGALGVGAQRPIAASEIEALLNAEERIHARVVNAFGFGAARRTTTDELQWLLRRSACRGLGEPAHDPHWQPGAVLVEAPDGKVAYEPRTTDLLRFANAPILEEPRALVVDSELGRSFQAMLTLGALPEEALFPGRAELLYEPLEEGVDFPVDATVHVRWLGNRQAINQVRKRIVDATNVAADELRSEHGPITHAAEDNRALAQELEVYLQGQARPPLLQTTITLAVGAASRAELEARVEALRDRYQPTELYRPAGLQPRLFFDSLPRADGGTVDDYTDHLTIEQLGALVPHGTHHVGHRHGVYIATITTGGQRPVYFEITAAPREGRPPSILLAGTLGSGKTIAAELLAINAAMRGSLVVDLLDHKPDHAFDRVPALDGKVNVIELSGDERYRGVLDPLAIAPPNLREDLAASYFMDLLPGASAGWETHIRRIIRAGLDVGETSSLRVIERLHADEHPEAQQIGQALAVWADSGLARLAFGDGAHTLDTTAQALVTTVRAPDLQLPDPTTARGDYDRLERVGVGTLKLLTAYAMRLITGDRTRHKVVLVDEAWFLLSSRDGQRLISRLNRLGRTENATLILATQQLGDIGEIENLIGTRFIFGQETEQEARRGLALLGLDPNDDAQVAAVRAYRKGRCLMRDLDDRIAEIQIEVADPDLLNILDTSPAAHTAQPA